MKNFSLRISDKNPRAGVDCSEFIQKIEEHHLFEGNTCQLRYSINLGDKILMVELISGIPLDSIIKSLGNWQ